MNTEELARAIDTYLKGFGEQRLATIRGAHARVDRHWVLVKYGPMFKPKNLTRKQAATYLQWLEAGNVGTHHDMEAALSQEPS